MLINSYSKLIECGTDEAGRGCLAGPVTAAAVILPNDFRNTELNDSKKLSESKRSDLKKIIIEKAIDYSIVHIPEQVIEKINILNASILAMNTAIENLKIVPEFIIVDGNKFNTHVLCIAFYYTFKRYFIFSIKFIAIYNYKFRNDL